MKFILLRILGWFKEPFAWSKWVDITTFHYAGGHLLQGRLNTISNAKEFRITKMKQSMTVLFAEAPFVTLERLTNVGLASSPLEK